MSNKIEVVSVNISEEKGTTKHPVEKIEINEHGIVSDAHSGPWHRQVSLLPEESMKRFAKEYDLKVGPGDFAENITTKGLAFADVGILDKFIIGEVELEVTQIGKECHGEGCAIFQQVGKCVMPKEGVFCKVLNGGSIAAGDEIQFIPKPLKCKVITLSDRAFSGEYEDRSGPRIVELLEEFFSNKPWHPQIESVIFPDDPEMLIEELVAARDNEEIDLIITTGGTGIGPRDMTTETVTEFCDKLIPGIMEWVRVKCGENKPNALLSRSVAGVSGKTLVYALPGSVKAVQEYMEEIVKTLEHCILMLNAVDNH